METIKNSKPKILKTRTHRCLGRVWRIFASLLLVLVLILIFIRSPWGQGVIVDYVVDYIGSKTNTEVAIKKLYITFDGDIQLDGLYLEDTKGDTLVYSKALKVNIPLWATLTGKAVGIDNLDWDGLRANIIRKDTITGYNFQFLIDAFLPAEANTVVIDSTATPMPIIIGSIHMQDVNIVFEDAIAGITSVFKIGETTAHMKTTDIEAMVFDASHMALTDAHMTFIQKPMVTDTINTITSERLLPNLSMETFTLDHVVVYYESQTDQIIADMNINDFYAESSKINLLNNNIDFNKLHLNNSKIALQTETNYKGYNQENDNAKADVITDTTIFEWPQMTVNITDINLQNNDFIYRVGVAKPLKNVFDAKAIALKQFNLKGRHIFLKDKKAGFELEQTSFNSNSGLNLLQLALTFEASDDHMILDNLKFQVNDNLVSGYAALNYTSITALLKQPEQTLVDLNLRDIRCSLQDVFKYQPALKARDYWQTLSEHPFVGSLKASGSLAAIMIENFKMAWGDTTHMLASGVLQNPMYLELLTFDMPGVIVKTKRDDLIQFIKEKDLGINLPKDIELKATLKGGIDHMFTNTTLTTSQGSANIKGDFKNTDVFDFNTTLTIADYRINELLGNPQFGRLSLTLQAKGRGSDIKTLDAVIDANIGKFILNDYPINDLKIMGDIAQGQGNLHSSYKDDNLNVNLEALVVLDTIAPEISTKLHVIGANLQALGFMQRNVRVGMLAHAGFKGNTDNYNATVTVEDGVVVYDNKSYLLGAIEALVDVKKDTTSISLNNKMVNLLLQSNTDPQRFTKALKRHMSSYFYRDIKQPDSSFIPVNLILKGKVSQSPLLKDVFLVNVQDLDTIDLSVNFDEKARHLAARLTAPHINYSGNELDSLAFSMKTDEDNFDFNLGFKTISAGPLDIPKTVITGHQTNNELALNFLGYHDDERLMNVTAKIIGNRERLVLQVNPDSLVLNADKWFIPKNNEIILTDNKLEFNDFTISKDNQSIAITNTFEGKVSDHIALDFKNFRISELFNYLNPDAKLVTGDLNGDFVLENPFRNTGILADLSVNKLRILDADLGTLRLNGNALSDNNYAFNIGLKGGAIDLDLVGDYVVQQDNAELDLKLNINHIKMEALNALSLGKLKNGKGGASGKFTVTGSTTNPMYEGSLNFVNAEFNISKLNTPFKFVNETLSINNDRLSMSDFTIRDDQNNALVISGDVGIKNVLNPTFNLNLKATNFKILDATVADNKDFYGQASFNANARLTGDLQIPKLDANLTLGSDTKLVYVMPSAVVNVEKRDGVVLFVNRENPDAILTQTEEQTATIKGFDIKTLLKISKEASVTIVIDEETGDNFKVRGDGDFNFTMNPNGRLNLSGVYEVTDGHYELNLYNLVNRRFDIEPGSRVTWSGDPFDANLDVRAVYQLEASASSLMAAQTSGADPSVTNKYREVLPFLVYLNINGELLQPQISFKLDMPEAEQGAVGGEVFGRVQQVNSQESELNRQVFSLLVLNRFYPDPGSDGSSGGFASIAKDNLNDAVADQLNLFSNKLLGKSGVELDFGLDSFTDFQGDSEQDRTQLDIAAQKKLFDDRLTVRVGSEVDIQGSSSTGEATPLIGNISLEYKLSQDGKYHLKGFRRSEFENIIDGQTIVSGIALIFTQEFNKFSELWDAILRSRFKKRKKEKQEAEAQLKAQEEEVNSSIQQKKN